MPRTELVVIDPTHASSTEWLRPPEEQEGLKRYVETFRERFWLIVLTVVITTGIAILYVSTATKTYEAEATLLVSPVSADDPVLASLGLIALSSDPTRDVETASQLVTNLNVARAVKQSLNSPLPATALLSKVTVVPVAQSYIIAVTATETSPLAAKRIADAFAIQAVETRTQRLHEQIEAQLPILRTTLGPKSSRVQDLEVLATSPTPDMHVQTLAAVPTTQASPRPVLSVAAGIFAGVILGAVAAFAAQVLDPRLRREAQLRRLYRLPILGRIPKETRTASTPLVPRQLSAASSEAYRTLRTTVTGTAGQVILVTGSGASEGKSTTAVNLAASIALAGRRVVLIESDLRKPVLSQALQVTPPYGGVVGVLLENVGLTHALTQTEPYGTNLQLLLSDHEGGWFTDLLSLRSAQRMVEEARQIADYVVIDSPPLNEVVDALDLARLADSVLIVVKLGQTRLDKLSQLGELLAENDIRPTGFAVVGVPRPRRSEYQYYRDSDGAGQGSGRSLFGGSRA
ncbi:MAG: AAA family ATPase [Solirubrobacterales bacterium]